MEETGVEESVCSLDGPSGVHPLQLTQQQPHHATETTDLLPTEIPPVSTLTASSKTLKWNAIIIICSTFYYRQDATNWLKFHWSIYLGKKKNNNTSQHLDLYILDWVGPFFLFVVSHSFDTISDVHISDANKNGIPTRTIVKHLVLVRLLTLLACPHNLITNLLSYSSGLDGSTSFSPLPQFSDFMSNLFRWMTYCNCCIILNVYTIGWRTIHSLQHDPACNCFLHKHACKTFIRRRFSSEYCQSR